MKKKEVTGKSSFENSEIISQRGFTLIELLMIVGIISVLAAIVAVGIDLSRKKGRDSQRTADIKQFLQAFELFFQEHNRYPNNVNDLVANDGEIIGDDNGKIETALIAYMTRVPADKLFKTGKTGVNDFFYAYDPTITGNLCEGVFSVNRFETSGGVSQYGSRDITTGADKHINTADYNFCFRFSY